MLFLDQYQATAVYDALTALRKISEFDSGRGTTVTSPTVKARLLLKRANWVVTVVLETDGTIYVAPGDVPAEYLTGRYNELGVAREETAVSTLGQTAHPRGVPAFAHYRCAEHFGSAYNLI